jgi:hypothetical protein
MTKTKETVAFLVQLQRVSTFGGLAAFIRYIFAAP